MTASSSSSSSYDLVLIGLRASGKTTLGKHLAAELWRTFIDLDTLVLTRLGQPSILTAWNTLGETAWRETESAVMRELFSAATDSGDAPQRDRVIATGGGAPVIESVRQLLEAQKQAGRVRIIHLDCDPRVLCDRLSREFGATAADLSRPALTDQPDLLSEIQAVKAQRDPIYRALAHQTIDVSSLAVGDIAGWIVRNGL